VPKPLDEASARTLEPQLRLTSLGVGHGDATLIESSQSGGQSWRCLVDGGGASQLGERLRALGVTSLDLLVATHADTDHVGGLADLSRDVTIGEYWGPCLPAFERHLWLFGASAATAIQRLRAVEESLGTQTKICYPLEGYTSQPAGSLGPTLHVLSPAARLIHRLLTQDDVTELLTTYPTSLGWLLEPASEMPQESREDLEALEAALARSAIDPAHVPPRLREQTAVRGDPARLADEWSASSKVEPEFFGDSLLNNTSLVVWLEARTGSRLHRVLLPGDQENWTYLLFKNPRGLQADVFKASHHGGRVYIEKEPSKDEVFSHIRPRVLLVSGNGRHGLPRAAIREAAIRWGAAVFCTSSRTTDFVDGGPEDSGCCHENLGCSSETKDVTMILDASGIRGLARACHSGYGNLAGPVIRVRQEVIDPSSVVRHLFEGELRKHIAWVGGELKRRHQGRRALATHLVTGSDPMVPDDLLASAQGSRRLAMMTHMHAILEEGAARGAFWAKRKERWSGADWWAYALPRPEELEEFLELLSSKVAILFPRAANPVYRDPDGLLSRLDHAGLAAYADAALHFPQPAFRDLFWPAVASFFRSNVHAFVHKVTLGVAVSPEPTPRALLARLVRAFLDDDHWGRGWRKIEVDAKDFPFRAPVLVSGLKEHEYAEGVVVSWLTLYREAVSEGVMTRIEQLSNQPGKRSPWDARNHWDEKVRPHVLGELAGGEPDLVASLLEEGVEQLW
jgi:beta-lactamase superfamily II metal-dependent hydrolase